MTVTFNHIFDLLSLMAVSFLPFVSFLNLSVFVSAIGRLKALAGGVSCILRRRNVPEWRQLHCLCGGHLSALKWHYELSDMLGWYVRAQCDSLALISLLFLKCDRWVWFDVVGWWVAVWVV